MAITEFLFSALVLKAFIAGAIVACGCAVLGCFVVWRKMAFFGDALSHSCVLGIALGLLSGFDAAIFLVCLIFAVAVLWIQKFKRLGNDTILGVVSHSALAAGLIVLSLIPTAIDIEATLFGDILALTWRQIGISAAAIALALLMVGLHWNALLMLTFNEQIARSERFASQRTSFSLLVAVTLTVGVAVQLVGVLMASALLLIPAATASLMAKEPENAVGLALVFAMTAIVTGIILAGVYNQPIGPVVVIAATAMFVLALLRPVNNR